MPTNIDGTASVLDTSRRSVLDWQDRQAPIPEDLNNIDQVKAIAKWLAGKYDAQSTNGDPSFPQRVLNGGFIVGLVFCGLAFLGTVIYLSIFLWMAKSNFGEIGKTPDMSEAALVSRLMVVKMALLSCGVLAGSALAFLGLSLFLMGIRSVMNVDATGASFTAKLVNVAPGTLVLLCSAILIGLCTTREFSFQGSGWTLPAKPGPPHGEDTNPPGPGTNSVIAFFSADSTLFESVEKELVNIQKRATEPNNTTAEELKELKKKMTYLPDLYNERVKEFEKAANRHREAGQAQEVDNEDKKRAYSQALQDFYGEALRLTAADQIETVLKRKPDIIAKAQALPK